MMKLSLAPMQTQPYLVLAVDPETETRCVEVPVRALCPHDAREAARRELAKTKRDHWSLTAELERATAQDWRPADGDDDRGLDCCCDDCMMHGSSEYGVTPRFAPVLVAMLDKELPMQTRHLATSVAFGTACQGSGQTTKIASEVTCDACKVVLARRSKRTSRRKPLARCGAGAARAAKSA